MTITDRAFAAAPTAPLTAFGSLFRGALTAACMALLLLQCQQPGDETARKPAPVPNAKTVSFKTPRNMGTRRPTASTPPSMPNARIPDVEGVAQARWRRMCRSSGGFSFAGVAALPNGRWLVASHKKLEQLDRSTGQVLETIALKVSPEAMAVDPKGRWVALGSSQGAIDLWDLRTRKSRPFEGHKDWINGLAFDPSGRWLASASQDQTVRIWSVANATIRHTFMSPEKSNIYSVAFAPGGKQLLVGGYKQLHLYEPASGKRIASVDGPASAIRTVAFHPAGKRFVAASDDAVQEFDAITHKALRSFPGSVSPALYSPDGKSLLLARKDKRFEVRELATQRVLYQETLTAKAMFVAFGPSSRRLALIQRFDHVLNLFAFDAAPDLGLCVPSGRLYTSSGREFWLTLQLLGKLPRETVAYGKLSVTKAVDELGNSVLPVESSIPVMRGFSERNRRWIGSSSYGFDLSLRVNGLKPSSQRVARLEGSLLMRVARQSKTVELRSLAALIGKPIAPPELKALNIRFTLEPAKKGQGFVLRPSGNFRAIEDVSLLDHKGQRRGISRERWFGSKPMWTLLHSQRALANWKLVITVITKSELVRARFTLRNLIVPQK